MSRNSLDRRARSHAARLISLASGSALAALLPLAAHAAEAPSSRET